MEFLCIYIQEAHPSDGWQVDINLKQDVVYSQGTTEAERADIAEACVLSLNLELPMLLDEMSNEVDEAYAALPERLYLINPEGIICFKGNPGPWGFDIESWESAIIKEIG